MRKKIFTAFAIVLLSFYGCNSNDSDENLTEPEKDISGDWMVSKILRNGEDITSQYDYSQFRIHFNADGTYSFENYLPFVVSEPGTWSLDDRQYAFKINFESNSQNNAIEFNYPIVDGKRRLQISGSPGCTANTYTYTLDRVSQ